MSNIISSLGGGSGIDTTSLVSQLTSAERAPKEALLDSRQEKLESQISGYGLLKSALSEFQGVLSPLAKVDTFSARSVAFPETDLITPNSLAAGAQTGAYQIEVQSVASAQTLVMGSTTDKNAALGGSGTLSLQFGAWTYDNTDPQNPVATSFATNGDKAALEVGVEASDSLTDIAKKINDSDSGIQASVMRVGDQYQLMLTAPSGENNALMITGTDDGTATGAAANLLSGYSFNESSQSALETQQGSDAILKVNGLTVQRESNTIDDVIEGFSFTVNKASVSETINFSVDEDKAVAEQAIRDFVDAYNLFFETAKNLTGYSKDEDNNMVRGELANDGTAKSMVRQLRSIIGTEVTGIDSGFTALTNLGIRTELDGTLSIEETEFSAAMSNNFDLVADLFAQKASSTNGYVDVGVGTRGSSAVPGSYDVEITQDPEKGKLTGGLITHDFGAGILDATGGGYSFKVNVNGTLSGEIVLNGQYASAEELRDDLQSLINGNDKLKAVNAAVDVTLEGGQFVITSREYGSDSKVAINNQSAAMDGLGLGSTSTITETTGKDVKGTINGVAGFGAGEVLLPALGSGAYGLNLTISPGATSEGAFSISFSQGKGGELNNLISRFLASDGAIARREETIDNQMEKIGTDREELDRRMEKYESRLSAQFLAMERIISSLNSTGSSLDGLIDRLPFTAQK